MITVAIPRGVMLLRGFVIPNGLVDDIEKIRSSLLYFTLVDNTMVICSHDIPTKCVLVMTP
jgi:hypothetical protein